MHKFVMEMFYLGQDDLENMQPADKLTRSELGAVIPTDIGFRMLFKDGRQFEVYVTEVK